MPAYKIIITPEALANLEAIHEYIAADSPDNAARMIERILDAAHSLEDMPQRHAVIRTRRRLGYEARAVVVGPYRMIYSVDGTAVYVRTVRHGARRPWP
jgi:plasmid stabilization system protein ParE